MQADLLFINLITEAVGLVPVRTVKVMAMVNLNNMHILPGRVHLTSTTTVTKEAAHKPGQLLQDSILVQVGC
jgi:hypothetical protein